MQVLLVEDNRVNQIVASRLLGGMSAEVDIADNGAKALEFVRAKKYDVIFMDCQMPIMDGYAATGEIRKMEADGKINKAPIIALTAHAMQGDKQKCLDAGMDDYMSKPVTEEALADVVRKWVGSFCDIQTSNIKQKYRFKHVNPEDLEKLYNIMGDGFFGLIDIYFTSVAELTVELRRAISEEDYPTILRAAHTIKSPARQIGSIEVAAKAAEIEELAKEKGNLEEISIKFSVLRELLIVSNAELSKYVESKR